MRIKVIGKAHLKGIGKKSNKPYDFLQIHYNGPARGVEGVGALTANIDPALYSYADIVIGDDYVLEFDNRGYAVSFRPADKGGKFDKS